MKKALAVLSALALGSAAQSNGFLAHDNELRIRPISYNPTEDLLSEDLPSGSFRVFPTNFPKVVYVDDEQYANFNIAQNWHYPLPPLPMTNPYVPSPASAEIQAHLVEEEEDYSLENLLFDLAQTLQNQREVVQNKQEVRQIKVKGPGSSPRLQNDADDRTNVLPPHQPQHE